MADIINLRSARKNRQRLEKAEIAQKNRVKFGTPKSLKEINKSEKMLADKKLNGHLISDNNNGDE